MLTIRMQRTGRSGHAMFRVVVQDSRVTPTSGKVVMQLGSYDPHSKAVILNKEKAAYYLEHGAQPSERAARLLQAEGVKLPSWVTVSTAKQGKLRNPAKLRRNRPAEPVAPVAETPAEEAAPAEVSEAAAEPAAAEAPAEAPAETTEA